MWAPTVAAWPLILAVGAAQSQEASVVRNGANAATTKHVGCYYGVWAYTRWGLPSLLTPLPQAWPGGVLARGH